MTKESEIEKVAELLSIILSSGTKTFRIEYIRAETDIERLGISTALDALMKMDIIKILCTHSSG